MYFSSEGMDIPQDQAKFRHYDDEGNEYWEVDKILDRKIDYSDHRRVKYYVSWKGFGPDSCTWEPIENLETVLDDVAEFEKKFKQQKKSAKKASAKSQPKSKKTSATKSKKGGFEAKIEENSMTTEQENSSPIKEKAKLDESDSENSVRIKKKTRNAEGKSSAQRKKNPNSNEDSTASSNTAANKPPPILTEINLEASKENILTPNNMSNELLPPSSNIDPTFQNLSKLMEVEEKPSPIILHDGNVDSHIEEVPQDFPEEVAIEPGNAPQENSEILVPVPEVIKQELGGAKIASDKTKKNLEHMFDALDNAIESEDFDDKDDEDIDTSRQNTHLPFAQNSKKINVAEALKPNNIVIESDEEDKRSRKYSDNSKKDISPREYGRKDSGSRSPFDRKDSRDYKKNHYDKHGKPDKYDRHYDQKKKRDRSRSHDRDREKDHHRDHRDKERERERERDKDRYKSKDKPSHSHHHNTNKPSKFSFSTTKDSYNDKRDKSITPTNRDSSSGNHGLAPKVARISGFTDKPPNPPLEARKSTGMMIPRSYLASKAACKSALFFSKLDSSEDEDEEDNYDALNENHRTSKKGDKSKSPNNQNALESLKQKNLLPTAQRVEGEIVQENQLPKKREVVKKTLYAKNELKKDMEEEMGRYYKGLVGDYLQGKVNKEKFVEMLSPEGNFKEDQVQDILFMSWEGKATMNPQDYYFKVVWKIRENGVQMPSRLVSWSELLKESPENVAEFVMKKLLSIVTKYGTLGEC